jgi:hypothetical protein
MCLRILSIVPSLVISGDNQHPLTIRWRGGDYTAQLARISANAALPARVASDMLSKKSDCFTGLFLPAA